MPRLTVSVPKYARHRAKGLAYVRLSGKVYYLGPWQSAESKQEYSRLLAVYHASGGRMPDDDDCTVAELLDRYRVHCEAHYRHPDGSQTGEAQNIGFCCRPLRELFGAHPANDFGPLDLQAVRQEMIARGTWARSLINAACRKIVRAFKWAASQELVAASTFQSLQTVDALKAGRCKARESRPVEAVNDDVIAATLKHLPPIVADMVVLQRLIGCRPDELCRLRPADIDRTRDEVWVYTPARHKTAWRGKDRRVFIAGESLVILAKYLDRSPEAFCFSPAESIAMHHAKRNESRVTPLM